MAKVHGTLEWSVKSINFSTGCSHGCLYCYAQAMAERFKQVQPGEWTKPQIREHDVNKKHPKYKGQVMFPSSHDLTPENWKYGQIVLGTLLEKGNNVLIVSKPHLDVVKEICNEFGQYRPNILFRFTITSANNNILHLWEPGAPSYQERKQALKYAYEADFETSVSCEPMLDAENIETLVADLAPHITHSIWIGEMNYLHAVKKVSPEIEREVARIKNEQSGDKILSIYERLKSNPLVRWKDSIKKVVGLDRPDVSGLDI